MKRNLLNLTLSLLTIILFFSSCKKENYAPSLTLNLEPYIVYYNNQKYVLYDEEGQKTQGIPEDVEKRGDIQSYIDLNTLLPYSADDKGEFWSAVYLNLSYKYPGYNVSSYGGTEPTVKVTYDESIGIENNNGIDISKAGVYTFTYTATDEGQESIKKVHLRVYNSYGNLFGTYLSKLSKLNINGEATISNWTDDYGYGEAHTIRFTPDENIDKKINISIILNNSLLKGVIKGEETSLPTKCVFGNRTSNNQNHIEATIKGKVTDNDVYINSLHTDQPDTVETLVVITNRLVDNTTTGEIKNIQLANTEWVPLVAIEYSVERYIKNNNSDDYETSDGQKWESLDEDNEKGNWKNTFRETYIQQLYWTDENKEEINNQSGH